VDEGVRERVLRRVFGLKKGKLCQEDRKELGSDHIHGVLSLNICRGMNPSKMKWAKHVARMKKKRHIQDFDQET
jgi:hypothetical protein